MATAEELMKLDLYEILAILPDASDKEITKAYRKAALKCHPDKNPDKKAHEEFKRLSKILELLCDPAKRAAYDQSWKAKKAAAERVRQLDSKRRKLRDDLEAKERAHAEKQSSGRSGDVRSATTDQERVEKLREEGRRLLEAERLGRGGRRAPLSHMNHHVKAKWDPVSAEHMSYSEVDLMKIFRKYGNVVSLKMIGKSTAIIEFADRDSALHSMQELGHIDNPLDLDLLDDAELSQSEEKVTASKSEPPTHKRPAPAPTQVLDNSTFADMEAAILQRMMEAAAAQKQQKSDSA